MNDNNTTPLTPEALGRVAYNAYCASTGGKSAVSGADLPTWEQTSDVIRLAWTRAASAVSSSVGLHLQPHTTDPLPQTLPHRPRLDSDNAVAAILKHLDILGKKVIDQVTGVEGVAVSVGFDLYGCIQVIVNRGVDKEGKLYDQMWFDISRLRVLDETPVMKRPDWSLNYQPTGALEHIQARGHQGCEGKPPSLKP